VIELSSAQLSAWLATFLWPFCRILALFSSAPVLSHKTVPVRVRVALALLVTAIVAPGIAPLEVSPASAEGVMALIAQVAIGLCIGFMLRLVFAAIEFAGDMIGLQMGLSFATFVDPQNSNQTPLVGSFMSTLLMLLLLAVNGHLMVLAGVVKSFDTVPLDIGLMRLVDWHALALLGGTIFAAGLQIALPVLAAMLIANLALGVLTRTAPQLNLFAVGFPVTLMVGLLLLMILLPYLAQPLQQMIEQALLPVLG
jgi:flagellar biosynthetic protein FliR